MKVAKAKIAFEDLNLNNVNGKFDILMNIKKFCFNERKNIIFRGIKNLSCKISFFFSLSACHTLKKRGIS